MQIKAIETQYKGCRFRSRLEARWAVLFDALSVEWQYEKEGFDLGQELGWYLPDFYLPKFNAWAEVKPEVPIHDLIEYNKLLCLVQEQSSSPVGVFLGQIGQTDIINSDAMNIWRDIEWSELDVPFIDTAGCQLLCPACRCNYVHCENAINIDGKDKYASGRGNVRGNVIVIPAWCETGGHKWEMDFGFHKGNTYVALRNIQERIDDFMLILASSNKSLLEHAVTQAKSARFEHGESPKTDGYQFL